MEPSCIRQTLLPGTSRLFADYLYAFDNVRQFYGHDYSDPEAVRSAARAVNFPDRRRQAIVTALREQNGDSAELAKLSQRDTVAVVTGQQVGLFSGPAYTIFKALTAVRLARQLNEQGISAVPVFWLATEDHDLAEVDHTWVFNEHATPARLSVTSAVTNGGPVGLVRATEVPLHELRAAMGELPFAEEVAKQVAYAYRPGVPLGAAFRSLLQNVLRGCGLLYLDPLGPGVRAIAAEFLTEAAERVPELVAALRHRSEELTGAGYHAQVYLDEDSSLLFLMGEQKRTALRWRDGQFVGRDHAYTLADLSGQAERLSPNALLRPVMQDYLLPTAAYIGGPSETAYMAQAQVLYEKLLGRMPVIFPRNSFTLLDARATKLLERYGLSILQLLDCQEKVKSMIASRLVPTTLSDDFGRKRSEVTSALEHLQSHLVDFDPTLAAAAKKSIAKISYQLEKLSKKTAREAMRRDARAAEDAAYLMDLIYPHQHLQERFYSIVPFLAKHGFDLPSRLLEQTQLACPDHMVRTF
jgi:bacillithiol biosynthesis cysteine-adding enzyme BshC